MAKPLGVIGPIRITPTSGKFADRRRARLLQDHFNWLVNTGKATVEEILIWHRMQTGRTS